VVDVQAHFEFQPDWHRRGPARAPVRSYYAQLRSLLHDRPDLRPCLKRCRPCRIWFLTDPRNAGRNDRLRLWFRLAGSAGRLFGWLTKHGTFVRIRVWQQGGMAIRELLKEELGNSLRMERDYRRELARLPRGSIVRKKIGSRVYFYLAARDKDRVRFKYKGRTMDDSGLAKYREAKRLRVQYRRLLRALRGQIRFLRRTLHAEQAV
jgi:hypothetical protein